MSILKGRTAVKWNSYGNETSFGGCNTWNVALFDTRENAKKAIEEIGDRLDVGIITQKEVPLYHGVELTPFSGERLVIDSERLVLFSQSDGYIGEVTGSYR